MILIKHSTLTVTLRQSVSHKNYIVYRQYKSKSGGKPRLLWCNYVKLMP